MMSVCPGMAESLLMFKISGVGLLPCGLAAWWYDGEKSHMEQDHVVLNSQEGRHVVVVCDGVQCPLG